MLPMWLRLLITQRITNYSFCKSLEVTALMECTVFYEKYSAFNDLLHLCNFRTCYTSVKYSVFSDL